MSARLFFAAVVTAFARQQFNDAPQLIAPSARVAESDGLVSEHSASRIRAAFARFQRFIIGGGG